MKSSIICFSYKSTMLGFALIYAIGLPVLARDAQPSGIHLSVLASYESGIIDQSAAEIISYDAKTKRAFVTNAATDSIDVINVSRPQQPVKEFSIDVAKYGSPNSVAVKNELVAVAVESNPKQENGSVVIFDINGKFLNQFMVGALPDMLTFTPSGTTLLVANEGEPNDDYTIDPEGSISLIEISFPVDKMDQTAVKNATFTAFNDKENKGVRVFGPGASVSQDIEPEYITISDDSTTAWVSLQENNALAVVDIASASVTKLIALGTKDHNTKQTAIDASDKDKAVNIRPWPVKGLYQPDTIASYIVNEQTYIVTANEGDARDYDGFSEEVRVGDLKLSPVLLKQYPELNKNKNLGRLKTTTTMGDVDGDGLVDEIYSYGGRSFSIWNTDGGLVFDSGSDIARITAKAGRKLFNSDDSRSDDKGAEPEALTIGQIGEHTYAFIGLERTGGVMVYDISNPVSPYFIEYTNNGKVDGDIDEGTAGDVAPESIVFVAKEDSPIQAPLLLVANEVSGTTTVYRIEQTSE